MVRAPGIYYVMQYDKTGKSLYSATVIPNRGAWLEYETDSNDLFHVRIDRTRKLPITVLIRAMGVGSDAKIREMFGEDERIEATIEKDPTKSTEEGILEIYKRLRPGEPPTLDSAQALINSLFFDPRRYDLAKVGRYKVNKKLGIATRITNRIAFEDIVSPLTGEILVNAGEKISREKAQEAEANDVNRVYLNIDDRKVVVFSNNMVNIQNYIDFDPNDVQVNEKVYYPVLKEILDENDTESAIKEAITERYDELIPKHIMVEDILASINYMINLNYNIGSTDDIDHLGNRRLRSVGELLQNQFRIGLSRMERVVRERMTIQDLDVVTPQTLINIRPVTSAIKEFLVPHSCHSLWTKQTLLQS